MSPESAGKEREASVRILSTQSSTSLLVLLPDPDAEGSDDVEHFVGSVSAVSSMI